MVKNRIQYGAVKLVVAVVFSVLVAHGQMQSLLCSLPPNQVHRGMFCSLSL